MHRDVDPEEEEVVQPDTKGDGSNEPPEPRRRRYHALSRVENIEDGKRREVGHHGLHPVVETEEPLWLARLTLVDLEGCE